MPVIPRIRPARDGFEVVEPIEDSSATSHKLFSELQCPICMAPVQDPIMHSACKQLFCRSCSARTGHKCCLCRVLFTPCTDIPRLVYNLLAGLQVSCDQCHQVLTHDRQERHWRTECTYRCLHADCPVVVRGVDGELAHLRQSLDCCPQVCEPVVFMGQPRARVVLEYEWLRKLGQMAVQLVNGTGDANAYQVEMAAAYVFWRSAVRFQQFSAQMIHFQSRAQFYGSCRENMKDFLVVGQEVDAVVSDETDDDDDVADTDDATVSVIIESLPTQRTPGFVHLPNNDVKVPFIWSDNGKLFRRSLTHLTETEIEQHLLQVAMIVQCRVTFSRQTVWQLAVVAEVHSHYVVLRGCTAVTQENDSIRHAVEWTTQVWRPYTIKTIRPLDVKSFET